MIKLEGLRCAGCSGDLEQVAEDRFRCTFCERTFRLSSTTSLTSTSVSTTTTSLTTTCRTWTACSSSSTASSWSTASSYIPLILSSDSLAWQRARRSTTILRPLRLSVSFKEICWDGLMAMVILLLGAALIHLLYELLSGLWGG